MAYPGRLWEGLGGGCLGMLTPPRPTNTGVLTCTTFPRQQPQRSAGMPLQSSHGVSQFSCRTRGTHIRQRTITQVRPAEVSNADVLATKPVRHI